jgi:hypothetical protein
MQVGGDACERFETLAAIFFHLAPSSGCLGRNRWAAGNLTQKESGARLPHRNPFSG